MMRALMKPQALLYSMLAVLYVMLLRPLEPQVPAVFFLWLIAVAIMIIRLRFQWWHRYIWLDIAIIALITIWDANLALLAAPSIMVLMASGSFFAMPIAVALWGIHGANIDAVWPWLFAISSGIGVFAYRRNTVASVKHIDTLREKVYALEHAQNHLLDAHHKIERMSALSERDRIANALHDNLGHALTGALVALRAYESTHEDALDNPLFMQIKARLEKAVEQLKTTVHHTRVEEAVGFETFQNLINDFTLAPLDFDISGTTHDLSITHWQALVAVLKESLTNIQKHATPSHVHVKLLCDSKIIRLQIDNDGVSVPTDSRGFGLHYMRKHVASLGGSLSVQRSFLFTLICVLPKQLAKDGVYERLNR